MEARLARGKAVEEEFIRSWSMPAQEERRGSPAGRGRLWVEQGPVRGDEAQFGPAERQTPGGMPWRCWLRRELRSCGTVGLSECCLVHGLILGTMHVT